jgi:hypothetical protein
MVEDQYTSPELPTRLSKCVWSKPGKMEAVPARTRDSTLPLPVRILTLSDVEVNDQGSAPNSTGNSSLIGSSRYALWSVSFEQRLM